MKHKPYHMNRAQMQVHLVGAQTTVCVFGRGTGKSDGIIAPRAAELAFKMPRSTGVFLGATYAQLLTRTLPPVIAAWERMGYKRGIHFEYGKTPPKHFKRPITPPLNWEHAISWYNGSYIALVSQDRPGSANGLSIDWMIADEAKFLNAERLQQELLPAIRGNRAHFGELSEHGSKLYCTDMPTTASANWILDMEKHMDEEQVDLILQIQVRLQQLRNEQEATATTPARVLAIEKEMERLMKSLNELRKGLVYFAEASTLENIDVLGVDYIKQLQRDLPDFIFRTSVLNQRLNGGGEQFYPGFDAGRHCYHAKGITNRLRDMDFSKPLVSTSATDKDVIANQPLDIALDYGRFNCLVVGQQKKGGYFLLKNFYTKAPKQLKDLVKMFTEYYAGHGKKVVRYYYDHTATAFYAAGAKYADEVMAELKEQGWKVSKQYIGQAPSHAKKYLFWQKAFAQLDGLPAIMYNLDNCQELIISIENSPARQTKNGFEKDKSAERNSAAAQEHTTHFSDAMDTLVYGKFHHIAERKPRRSTGLTMR